MHDTVEAYDLGAIGTPRVARPVRAPFAGRTATRAWSPIAGPRAELRATLSLFLPGAGQLLRREGVLAAFFLTSIGFLAALAWAVIQTFDRLAGTLPLLEIPQTAPLFLLALAYLGVAGLHVIGVWNAALPEPSALSLRPHPLVSGLASTLAPGWGQLLNGDRTRAGLFLAGLWITGAVWIAGSEVATEFINAFVPAVPPWEQALREPIVLWTARFTLPALLWTLAVYDAASSAASRR